MVIIINLDQFWLTCFLGGSRYSPYELTQLYPYLIGKDAQQFRHTV
jgi:hypothetical protein